VESYYFTFGKMSKIGQSPIQIPSSVQVAIQGQVVQVKGSKGELSFELPHFLSIRNEENTLYIERKSDAKRQKASHGLYRSIIANAVKGVDQGWSKRLEIVGTGFNGKMQGRDINLKLGLSHPVIFKAPEGIQLAMEGNNIIVISGIDKQFVGEIAHQIKSVKKPDAYKGKGIRYEGEYVRVKPGKKAKAA